MIISWTSALKNYPDQVVFDAQELFSKTWKHKDYQSTMPFPGDFVDCCKKVIKTKKRHDRLIAGPEAKQIEYKPLSKKDAKNLYNFLKLRLIRRKIEDEL